MSAAVEIKPTTRRRSTSEFLYFCQTFLDLPLKNHCGRFSGRCRILVERSDGIALALAGSCDGFLVNFHVSRKAREKLSKTGFMMYSKNVRSPVFM
jgi:hypothetical protein